MKIINCFFLFVCDFWYAHAINSHDPESGIHKGDIQDKLQIVYLGYT